MSRTYYSELYLHVVWHTKESRPLLTPAIETETHQYLQKRLVDHPDVYVYEINGTENHVHLVLSVSPTILISDLIGQLKGASSHEINKKFGEYRKILQWQSGYGVVGFGAKDLPWVRNYVRNQKQHHANNTIHDRLERITPNEG